jgi:hypothetical protein
MSQRGDAVRRPARASMPARNRRRWQIVAAVVVLWIILWFATGSVAGAFIFLIALAALGAAAFFGLRALGVDRNHPWVQRVSSRPWRDGQDVLQVALKHLPEVFVTTPNGTLLAPDVVDLRMNPDDLAVLGERMDPGLVMESATEMYQETVASHHARLANRAPVEVRIIADPAMLPGRFKLRQGQPVNNYAGRDENYAGRDEPRAPEPPSPPPAPAPYPRPQLVPDHRDYGNNFGPSDGHTRTAGAHDQTATVSGVPTMLESNRQAAPPLRLITGGKVAETTISGARAGRGRSVELGLPEVPTVSREHAKFTYERGQWYVTNLGMNGITLNGQAVTGEHPVHSGDSIRWGTRPDALQSEVEIG